MYLFSISSPLFFTLSLNTQRIFVFFVFILVFFFAWIFYFNFLSRRSHPISVLFDRKWDPRKSKRWEIIDCTLHQSRFFRWDLWPLHRGYWSQTWPGKRLLYLFTVIHTAQIKDFCVSFINEDPKETKTWTLKHFKLNIYCNQVFNSTS